MNRHRIAETNELGCATTWAYDEFHRITTNVNALGQTTRYNYDLPGACGCAHTENNPTKIILPSGKQIAYGYDLEWQKLTETTGHGTPAAQRGQLHNL